MRRAVRTAVREGDLHLLAGHQTVEGEPVVLPVPAGRPVEAAKAGKHRGRPKVERHLELVEPEPAVLGDDRAEVDLQAPAARLAIGSEIRQVVAAVLTHAEVDLGPAGVDLVHVEDRSGPVRPVLEPQTHDHPRRTGEGGVAGRPALGVGNHQVARLDRDREEGPADVPDAHVAPEILGEAGLEQARGTLPCAVALEPEVGPRDQEHDQDQEVDRPAQQAATAAPPAFPAVPLLGGAGLLRRRILGLRGAGSAGPVLVVHRSSPASGGRSSDGSSSASRSSGGPPESPPHRSLPRRLS